MLRPLVLGAAGPPSGPGAGSCHRCAGAGLVLLGGVEVMALTTKGWHNVSVIPGRSPSVARLHGVAAIPLRPAPPAGGIPGRVTAGNSVALLELCSFLSK